MGTFSVWHWLIVLVVVLVLFGGGGKIPKLMRDMGQGINAFKKGLKEEEKQKAQAETEAEAKKAINTESAASSVVEEKEKDTAATG